MYTTIVYQKGTQISSKAYPSHESTKIARFIMRMEKQGYNVTVLTKPVKVDLVRDGEVIATTQSFNFPDEGISNIDEVTLVPKRIATPWGVSVVVKSAVEEEMTKKFEDR